MTREELDLLSKEQLLDLVLIQMEQLKQLAQLQTAFQQLQADYEALKLKMEHNKKPPTSSKNSSQPPSRDQKENQPQGRHRHRHGPPVGHEKHERKFVAQADRLVYVRVKKCQQCHTQLADEGRLVKVNQITELPEAKAQVIEVRQYETLCPECGHLQFAEPPVGLEMERTFGARLEATVVYYRQEQHMSYERTQKALRNLHGVEISQGGIDNMMQRVGDKAIQAAKPILQTVRQSAVIHSDETTSRVGGDNWWEWVFCTTTAILHVTRFNRSVDIIREVMDTFTAEVWVSDCFSAQLKAPAKQLQLCMAHQLRNLQAVVDAYPTSTWPRAMQVLFRYAIHLHHQRHQLSPDQFSAQLARVERHCDRLLQRILAPPEAKRLKRRYRLHRQKLFVFLYRSDVEPTNNVAERALRSSVIHRKVTGCFRSEWGAKAFAALASVIDTAELAGIQAFDAIQSLFGSPSLPIPTGGE
jgi:transposase